MTQEEKAEESPPTFTVNGKFIKEKTRITDSQMQNMLAAKGYGDFIGGGGTKKNNNNDYKNNQQYMLNPVESLYLVYINRLHLKQNHTRSFLNFDKLFQIYKKVDQDILTKFLIYRDLRTHGYVVKDGFGFGSDFRVYDKGDFGQKGAKYLVFALSEGQQERIGTLYKKVSQITQMGKEPIIAVVDRRGEIIYYKISGINFAENKFSK